MEHFSLGEINMKMYVFEGTPDEIGMVMKSLRGAEVDATPSPTKARPPLPLTPFKGSVNEGEERKFVTIEFARQVMTRLPLSAPFERVLIALKEAHPDLVSTADLYKASGYVGQHFAGLMGAFGRRMKHTKGYDDEAHFFNFEWDEEAGGWKYGLPDSVLEAIRLEGVARDPSSTPRPHTTPYRFSE